MQMQTHFKFSPQCQGTRHFLDGKVDKLLNFQNLSLFIHKMVMTLAPIWGVLEHSK